MHNFWHLADIHYDPLLEPDKYGPSKYCRPPSHYIPLDAEEEIDRDTSMERYLSVNGNPFGWVGCDTTFTLLNSA